MYRLTLILLLGITLYAGERFKIGFPQDDMSNEWRAAQVFEAKKVFDALGNVEFIYSDAKGHTATQLLNTKKMIDEGIDLLMISPKDSEALRPAIEEAYDKGIPVVVLTRAIEGDKYTTFIGPNDYEIAKEAAQKLAESIDFRGDVVVLQGVISSTTAQKRTEGFMQEITKYGDINVIKVLPANYKRADAAIMLATELAEGLRFDAIFSQSDSMASGARATLERFDIDPKTIKIIGIDYIKEAQTAIKEGKQLGSFTYPTCGKEGAEAAMKILNKQSVPKKIEVKSNYIDISGIESNKPIF